MRAIVLRARLLFILLPPATFLSLSLSATDVFFFFLLVQRRLCRFTKSARDPRGKRARRRCVHTLPCVRACVHPCCPPTSLAAAPRERVCVRVRAHARASRRLRVCGRARRVRVYAAVRARERFTPDYNASRASVPSRHRKTIGVDRGKARAAAKIASACARIYRAALTALGRAESIYFVGTVCAANTVG